MTDWLRAIPEIALALTILGLPGLVLAWCLGFRRWDAAALAAPLSLGVLTAADVVSKVAHVRWGLPVITATALLAAVCCGIVGQLVRRRSGNNAGRSLPRVASTRKGEWVAVALTLGAALAAAWVAAKGIGSPVAINQTFDGAFHINSIDLIATRHSASPGVFGYFIGNSESGFYPPLFAAVASLLVTYAGVTPIVAANVTAVAIAFLWPLTVSIAIRRLARPHLFGYGVAMAGAVTIGLFPALLLSFGTLWPNALSYLTLAPVLVLLARVSGLIGGNNESDAHERLPLVTSVVAGAITAVGLAYAHPGVLYLSFYLAMPLLIWVGWRCLNVAHAPWAKPNLVKSLSVIVAAGIFFEVVVEASYQVHSIALLRQMYWPPLVSWYHAVGQVLVLDSHLSGTNIAMGVLVLAGLATAWRSGRGRYLIAGYLLVATLAVLTAGVETRITMHWTGFWYNDPYRLLAALPAIALPLIALGADASRAWMARGIERILATSKLRLPGQLSATVAAAIVVCLGVVAVQGGLGTGKVSATIAGAYRGAHDKLVTRPAAEMFERLGSQIPKGATIAGDPFTGAVLAGVLSGHPTIYETFRKPIEHDLALVGKKFRDFQHDPAVCAAVKRLKISVVIAGRRFDQESKRSRGWYAGFTDLRDLPGLTPLDSGGGVQAFRVGPCNSTPHLSGN